MFVKNKPTESLLFWRQLIDVLFPPSVTQACDFYVFDILNYCLGLISQRSDKKWGLDARNSLCYVYAIHLEPFEACFNAYLLLLKPKRARYDTGEKVLTTASLPSPKKQCWSQVSRGMLFQWGQLPLLIFVNLTWSIWNGPPNLWLQNLG